MSNTTGATKCPHCNGSMEIVTPPRMASFKRCSSCGRDDRAPISGNGSSNGAVSGTPCSVKGCPGRVLAGRCACCEKRERFVVENAPTRLCAICEGKISGSRNRKYCEACGVVMNRVHVAKSKGKS